MQGRGVGGLVRSVPLVGGDGREALSSVEGGGGVFRLGREAASVGEGGGIEGFSVPGRNSNGQIR